jgi:uncharacterized coiled-coil DUF342 family protein
LSLNDVLYHASQNLNNKFQNISNELKQILDEISSLKSQNSYLSNEIENIKSQYSHINSMLFFLKSQIEMITRSKPWRIYAMLGKIKRKLLKKKDTLTYAPQESQQISQSISQPLSQTNELSLSYLSSNAKSIYKKLKRAIEDKKV